jgi:predicted glycosyltransferase
MAPAVDIAESRLMKSSSRTPGIPAPPQTGKRIWIDLDNSPHVPFFLPIIEQLQNRGYGVILTARDSYQVCELLKFHHISCKVIGGHWGKNRALKILGTLLRATQLLPLMVGAKADLAVSHGSRAQLLSSFVLRIPTVTIVDYEFAAKVAGVKSDWIFMPHFIPSGSPQQARKQVLKYPGLKEDVYVPRFRPDPSLRTELGLGPEDLVVTLRPPATEAHYHNAEAEVLLDAALNLLVEKPEARVILLPRNEKQARVLRRDWAQWIKDRKVIIPDQVVDGLNLIWISDLVISGGGTMNREAAALGVPVYSIFRGSIGGVDQYLASSGRLVLIESVEDIRTKVVLKRRALTSPNSVPSNPVLESIVAGIISIAECQCLPESQ